MSNLDIDQLVADIRKRYDELTSSDYNERIIESFKMHAASLAKWYNEPMDYPEISDIDFPESVYIAYAVCHPECGAREFIVDGSTQQCQHCGASLFRTEVAQYKFIKKCNTVEPDEYTTRD